MAEYVTHEQAAALAKKCQENVERLHSCDGHDFRRDDADAGLCVCRKCGGWVSAESAKWYTIGHSHGHSEAMKGNHASSKRKG